MNTAAQAMLRTKGRTFWLASQLLPQELLEDVAALYAFCRAADDAVDEAASVAEGAHAAQMLALEIDGRAPPRPLVQDFLELATRRGIEVAYARDLLRGVASDAGPVRVADDAALGEYAYLVAGTVGGMMRALLGATDARSEAPAVALGIGMQLTNICRDVAEDAARDRVYLPQTRLLAAGLTAEQVLTGDADRAHLAVVVKDVLGIAEGHYREAERGLAFLPWRARLAIAVAGRMYRGIGRRLLRVQRGDALRGRVVVPLVEKLALAAVAIFTVGVSALFQRRTSTSKEA